MNERTVDENTKLTLMEITAIDCEDFTAYSCNNCGAHSTVSAKNIKHHKECKPSEAKYWEDFYNKANEEDSDKCPFDGESCWHWVQGHCIHINGVVPKGKPCDRHPTGKGGE